MLHEPDGLARELRRLADPPALADVPPVLCVFELRVAGEAEAYAAWLRTVVAAALQAALTAPDHGDLPDWFADVTGGAGVAAPGFARRGAEAYAAAVGGGPWRLEEWLAQFEPDNEFRGWAWWDLTLHGDVGLSLWVDTWGESFFACDELRRLAYTAGAHDVRGPRPARAAEWAATVTEGGRGADAPRP